MALDIKGILDKVAGDNGAVDVKALIEKAVDALQSDEDLLKSFQKDPIKVAEKILGVDLPDEILEKVVEAVKAKIDVDDAKEVLGKIAGLFGRD